MEKSFVGVDSKRLRGGGVGAAVVAAAVFLQRHHAECGSVKKILMGHDCGGTSSAIVCLDERIGLNYSRRNKMRYAALLQRCVSYNDEV
jgi:hypothetical protein